MASLEDKAVETIDRITGVADQLAQKLTEFAPQVTEVALLAARVSAAQQIIWAGGFGMVAYAVFRMGRFCVARMEKNDWDDAIGWGIGLALCGITFIAMLYAALSHALNVFAWVGIFRPEIWLAHKLLNI